MPQWLARLLCRWEWHAWDEGETVLSEYYPELREFVVLVRCRRCRRCGCVARV